MTILPPFTSDGLLPPGDYPMTLYRIELYPHYGQGAGIRDSFGHELEFPSAFRRSRRNDAPRGIIKLRGRP